MLLYINKETISDMSTWKKALTIAIAFFGYMVIIVGVEKLEFISNIMLFYSHISLTLIFLIAGLYISNLDIRSICNTLLNPVYPFGKISYGIYVIHYPILLFFIHTLVYFELSVWWCVIFIPATLATACFTEQHYQPFILRHIDPVAMRLGIYAKGKS